MCEVLCPIPLDFNIIWVKEIQFPEVKVGQLLLVVDTSISQSFRVTDKETATPSSQMRPILWHCYRAVAMLGWSCWLKHHPRFIVVTAIDSGKKYSHVALKLVYLQALLCQQTAGLPVWFWGQSTRALASIRGVFKETMGFLSPGKSDRSAKNTEINNAWTTNFV